VTVNNSPVDNAQHDKISEEMRANALEYLYNRINEHKSVPAALVATSSILGHSSSLCQIGNITVSLVEYSGNLRGYPNSTRVSMSKTPADNLMSDTYRVTRGISSIKMPMIHIYRVSPSSVFIRRVAASSILILISSRSSPRAATALIPVDDVDSPSLCARADSSRSEDGMYASAADESR
jgi:hypothetical protein